MDDSSTNVNHPKLMSVGEDYSRRRRVHTLACEPVWLKLVAWLAVALVSHPADLPAKLAAGAPLAARLFSSAGGTVLSQLLAVGAHTPVEETKIEKAFIGNCLACDPQVMHGKHDCTGSRVMSTGPQRRASLRRTRLCSLEHCHTDVLPPDTLYG